MRLTIAYSQADERDLLEKVFSSEGDVVAELVQVSEERLKFEVKNFDVVYVSPLLLFQENAKFLTSLAKVEKRLVALKGPNDVYLVRSTLSLEYCLLRAKKLRLTVSSSNSGGQEEDLTNIWNETCDNLPPISKVLASFRLSDDEMRRVKAVVRKRLNSIDLPENFVKELGKMTEKFVQCIRNLCENAGLPILSSPVPF